jgi:hypothetical protein
VSDAATIAKPNIQFSRMAYLALLAERQICLLVDQRQWGPQS